MRRRNSALSLLLGVAIAISSAPLAAVAAPDAPPVPPKLQALLDAQGEPSGGEAVGLIVRYAPGVAPSQGGEVTGAARVAVELTPGDDLGRGLRTVDFDETLTAEQALEAAAQLEASPLVVDASPNFVYRVGEVVETADESFVPPYSLPTTQTSTTWALGRIDQASSALDYKYSYDTTGEGVTAYIVDTGIRPTHVEFTGRLAPGFKLPQFATTGDCNGHGTHVAGTVGGTTYGVAKKVTLVPVRVFGCDGSGDTVGIVQALDWIIADHQSGEPAVINMSLGSAKDDLVNTRVQDAINDGITVVVASGNFGESEIYSPLSCDYSPASAPNAITVNASTSTNNDASYSNFGRCSDIYAPGSSIKSADKDSNTDTKTLSGTSMAAPHVAGVVARILSHEPDLTPAEVTARVMDDALYFNPGLNDDIADFCAPRLHLAFCTNPDTYFDPELLLFASQLPTFPNTPPTPTIAGAPVGTSTLTATVGSWLQTAPEPDVDPPLTYQWRRSGTAIPGATDLEYTLTPADVGKTITFTVTGNVQGYSTLAKTSTPTAVVSRPALGVPTSINVLPLPGRIGIEWGTPAQTGGTLSDYVIQYRPTTSSTFTTFNDGVGAVILGTEITGLKFGTSYYVRVAAKDEFGVSTFTPPVLVKTLTGLPTAPTGLTATAAPRSIQLDWIAPATTNGGTISDYVIRFRVTGTTTWRTFADGVGTETTATVTGLSGSRSYEFAVQAKTQYGVGATALIKRSTLSGLASLPVSLLATPSRTAMELTWNAPSTTNGGGDVLDYVVKYRRTGTTTWITLNDGVSSSTGANVSGLTRATSYEFAVAAVTQFGTASSAIVKRSTLTGLASAPTGLVATPSLTGLAVSWSAPSTTNDGGDITDYVVRYRVTGSTTWITVNDGISSVTEATITGLMRNKSYDVVVSAKTLYGTGPTALIKRSTLSGIASAPTGLTVTRTSQTLELSWTPPSGNGGTIIDYVVRYRSAGATAWTTVADGTSTNTTASITGLIRERGYEVSVFARTQAGAVVLSGASATNRVTTASGVPGVPVVTPQSIMQTSETTGQVTLGVASSPDPFFPITGYTVEYRLGTGAWVTAVESISGNEGVVTIPDLILNSTYEFRASAMSGAGTSGFSTPISVLIAEPVG